MREVADKNMRQKTGSGLPRDERPRSHSQYVSKDEAKREARRHKEARNLWGFFGHDFW